MENFFHIRMGHFFFARACACKYSSALALIFSIAFSASAAPAPVSFQAAVKNLSSQNYGICLAAIDQLGHSGQERATLALAQAFNGEKRMIVRRAMVDALGLLRFASGRAVVVTALQDPDAQVRQSAVIALEAIGGSESDAALLQQAANEKDFAVKANLIQILGRSRNPKAAERLKAMAQDKNPQLRDWAQKEIDRKGKHATK